MAGALWLVAANLWMMAGAWWLVADNLMAGSRDVATVATCVAEAFRQDCLEQVGFSRKY
jgi:hypothetical protein